MALPSRAELDDWSSEIAEDAIGEMNGVACIIKPNAGDSTEYDPTTDTGGTAVPTVIISPRRARIQHLRAPSDATGAAEWGTKTGVRIQIEIKPSDPLILKGM